MKLSYLFKNITEKIASAFAEAKAYTDNAIQDIGTYTTVTGTMTTKSWAVPDVYTSWVAPSDGLYLITIRLMTEVDASYTSTYKMFRWWGTATVLMGETSGLYFRGTTDGAGYGINGTMWTFPVLALQGQTVNPYVYTGTVGVVYNVQVCAIKVGHYVTNN